MDVVSLVGPLAAGACGFVGPLVVLRGRGRDAALQASGRGAGLAAALEGVPGFAELRRRELLRERRGDALRQMPTLLDIVTLGLSAGLSFDASLELYCQRYHTPLASAFNEALLSWRIGSTSRAEALDALADELEVSALRRFASAVTEALAFGTPLAAALEQQAQTIREEQRSQVEEEIEKVPVKMLIPLGTLILPAMLLAILGPLLGSALVA